MNVLLLQLDGLIPNLALMRLAAHHRQRGDTVTLQHARNADAVERGLWDSWDRVYASAIFTKTQPLARRLQKVFPDSIIGGTGVDLGKPAAERTTLERLGIGTALDYSDYPACRYSIGFTQRGCRLSCEFCDVPAKEGRAQSVATILDIWRGEPWPRHLMLLDNDFFGQAEWRERCEEILAGGFKVCFTQGINARLLSPLAADWLGRLRCTDNEFRRRRIYTAWDSMGDEGPLFRGLNALVAAGFRPDDIEVYMLIGYEQPSITEEDLYRHRKLREFGCRPFPMPYTRNEETRGFQRWIVRRADLKVSWDEYRGARCRPERLKRVALPLFEGVEA